MKDTRSLWFLENAEFYNILCPMKSAEAGLKDKRNVYAKGAFIYIPEDMSDRLFLIDEGRVKIGAYAPDGREIVKGVLQRGDVFGEMGLLGQEKREEYAQALEETSLCSLTLDEARNMMRDYGTFGLFITRKIGQKLQRMERRLESLVFRDARTRIVEFLHDLAQEKGVPVGDETLVRGFLTHKDIASLTGTSRQTVTTILNELREKNLIWFDRKRLLVRDLNKLAVA